MSCPVVDLTKILKVLTNGTVRPHFGFLIDTIKIVKYEMTFNGSHKILKVITNGTVRPHFGFLFYTINIVKYEMTFNGSHKILKVITNGTVRLRFGFLTDTIKIDVPNPKKKLLLHSWG
jgi:putative sterol carrier protein